MKDCRNVVQGNNILIVKMGLVQGHSRAIDMGNNYKSNILKSKRFPF